MQSPILSSQTLPARARLDPKPTGVPPFPPVADSTSGPNERELSRWTAKLDELYETALNRKNRWTNRDGKQGASPAPDIKGAVEVVRLALTFHGAQAIPKRGRHEADCRCPKCSKLLETAEDALRARVARMVAQ